MTGPQGCASALPGLRVAELGAQARTEPACPLKEDEPRGGPWEPCSWLLGGRLFSLGIGVHSSIWRKCREGFLSSGCWESSSCTPELGEVGEPALMLPAGFPRARTQCPFFEREEPAPASYPRAGVNSRPVVAVSEGLGELV